MAVASPDWTLWTARLRAQVPALQVVGAASEITELLASRQLTRPSEAWVVPKSYAATRPAMGAGSRVTEIVWRVAVLYTVLHYADPVGERSAAEFTTLQAAIWDALVGWVPTTDQGASAVEMKGGERVGSNGAVQLWVDEFEYRTRIS